MTAMTNTNIYQNITARTGGDIYLQGVVQRCVRQVDVYQTVHGCDGAASDGGFCGKKADRG